MEMRSKSNRYGKFCTQDADDDAAVCHSFLDVGHGAVLLGLWRAMEMARWSLALRTVWGWISMVFVRERQKAPICFAKNAFRSFWLV